MFKLSIFLLWSGLISMYFISALWVLLSKCINQMEPIHKP
jgi:hypothetical protein